MAADSTKPRGKLWHWLDELEFRRKGLAVSLIIILALIVGVVLKIRRMERRKPG